MAILNQKGQNVYCLVIELLSRYYVNVTVTTYSPLLKCFMVATNAQCLLLWSGWLIQHIFIAGVVDTLVNKAMPTNFIESKCHTNKLKSVEFV